jgi:hypothetical protein
VSQFEIFELKILQLEKQNTKEVPGKRYGMNPDCIIKEPVKP